MPEVVSGKIELKVGFVPLLDAAPLIAAHELGYFAEENLAVSLERQIGWGNVRDKLTFGNLHASHALLGMPTASAMRRPRYPEPLVSILSLGFGGNGITISRRLFDAGVTNAPALAAWIKLSPAGPKPLLFAHVFDCSAHHYLLRAWLSKAGINPDRQLRLCILPPPQMVRQIHNGYIDGFCAGEPWNTEAELKDCGRVLALSTDIVPAHPEKVLAVTRRWLTEHPQTAIRLVRALLRAGAFCGNPANRVRLIEILAQPQYLGFEPETLAHSFHLNERSDNQNADFYTISAAAMFPSAQHVTWLLSQMARWGHLNPSADQNDIAARSVDAAPYRAAFESISESTIAESADLQKGTLLPTA